VDGVAQVIAPASRLAIAADCGTRRWLEIVYGLVTSPPGIPITLGERLHAGHSFSAAAGWAR
jgi:hypothetical protein